MNRFAMRCIRWNYGGPGPQVGFIGVINISVTYVDLGRGAGVGPLRVLGCGRWVALLGGVARAG